MRLSRIIALFVLGLSGISFAGETCRVTGEVSFRRDADLYVCLFTADEFKEYPKRELAPPQCQSFPMSAELKKAGRLDFCFESVVKGTYGIVVFQDLNKNKKVDFENLVPNEPFGTYRDQDPTFITPQWTSMEFKVEKDLEGIKIQM